VLDVNASMRRCVSLPTWRLVGRPLAEVVHPDDHDRLQAALRGAGTRRRVEVRLLRVDGIAVWCEVATTRCLNPDGAAYLLTQFVDVHGRKVQELELETATRRDVLTGLANRSALTCALAGLLDPTGGGPVRRCCSSTSTGSRR
jgi:PAS domain S-box-containing protein